jgi:hypothetical protein
VISTFTILLMTFLLKATLHHNVSGSRNSKADEVQPQIAREKNASVYWVS